MARQELSKREQSEVTRREEQQVFVPPADIWETEHEIHILMDMPGVGKDDVECKVERNRLQVFGKVSEQPEGETIYAERRIGDFRREFTLSDDLDSEKIMANMDRGVLSIRVAKSERIKPRRIEIQSAS